MGECRVTAPEITSLFLTVNETAAYLRLTARALENFRQTGGGPVYRKHGGKVVYHKADLDAWSERLRYAHSGAAFKNSKEARA